MKEDHVFRVDENRRSFLSLHVNRIGKIRINHRLVPWRACRLEIPRMAISEDVSKPSPKTTPRGYIFQGRSTDLKRKCKRRIMMPPPMVPAGGEESCWRLHWSVGVVARPW